jgi:hypothetical protein
MRPVIVIAVFLALRGVSWAADPDYPLRDISEGEALPPSWWCDSYYRPVVILRGSLAAIQKERPDLSIKGPYAIWSKLTHPSLANEPAKKGFYLLLTQCSVKEVLYVDLTLRLSHSDIWGLAHHTKSEFDCILPAGVTEPEQSDKGDRGRKKVSYKLALPNGTTPEPNKEYILIFEYAAIYPLDGLHLTSFTELDNLNQVRQIVELRKGWKPGK